MKKTRENSKLKTIVYVYELLKGCVDLNNLKATDFENDFQVGVAEAIADAIYKIPLRLRVYKAEELRNIFRYRKQELDCDVAEDAWKKDYLYGKNYGAFMMRKLLDARETLKLFGEI